MPIQAVANLNSTNCASPKNVGYKRDTKIKQEPKCDKASTLLKAGVTCTTLLGVATAYALVLKGKGYSLNPSKILETMKNSPKKLGIFDVKYPKSINGKEQYGIEKLVGALAVGSIGGGLIGGAMFDEKKNMNAKYREAVIQLVGNVATPLACVWAGMRSFEKYEGKILKGLPYFKKLPDSSKITKIPKIIASAASLTAGIFLGNKVGNIINKNAFRVDDNRKIKIADMSPHIDDLCLATSMVTSDLPFVARIIPAALSVAGISTGIAKEKYNIIAEKAVEKAHKNELKLQKQQFKANQSNCKN